eukprot:7650630-Pyramimonas_sp.AAC.1
MAPSPSRWSQRVPLSSLSGRLVRARPGAEALAGPDRRARARVHVDGGRPRRALRECMFGRGSLARVGAAFFVGPLRAAWLHVDVGMVFSPSR